jgi:Aspartyl protease
MLVLMSASIGLAQSKSVNVIKYSGLVDQEGSKVKFEFIVAKDGRFLLQSTRDHARQYGFDGKESWTMEADGFTHRTEMIYGETYRSMAKVLAGIADQDIHILPTETTFVGSQINYWLSENKITFGLSRDKRTNQWTEIRTKGVNGDEFVQFSEYKSKNGLLYPTKLVQRNESGDARWEIKQVVKKQDSLSIFDRPADLKTSFKFDTSASRVLPIKYTRDRKIFVKARVGKEEGWFIFDSGTGCMTLSKEVAVRNGGKLTGKANCAGGVGSNTIDLYSGISFRLGPLTLSNPEYVVDNGPSQIPEVDGEPVFGIIGAEVFRRSAILLDTNSKTIEMFPSGAFGLPGSTNWRDVDYSTSIPFVHGSCEGLNDAIFALDTGSGNVVDITSPTVNRLKMLEGRQVKAAKTQSGGTVDSFVGPIKFIEIDGIRIENPRVGFQTTAAGAFSLPYFDGNVGMRWMEKSRVMFDLGQHRIAFLPHAQNQLLGSVLSPIGAAGGIGIVTVFAVVKRRRVSKVSLN